MVHDCPKIQILYLHLMNEHIVEIREKGWHILLQWKDNLTTWGKTKDVKESYHLQLS